MTSVKPVGTANLLEWYLSVSNDVQHPIWTATCYDFGFNPLFFTLIVISTRTWTATTSSVERTERTHGQTMMTMMIMLLVVRFWWYPSDLHTDWGRTNTHKALWWNRRVLSNSVVFPTSPYTLGGWTSPFAPGLIFSSDGTPSKEERNFAPAQPGDDVASHSYVHTGSSTAGPAGGSLSCGRNT